MASLSQLWAQIRFNTTGDDPNTDGSSEQRWTEVSPQAGLPVAIVDYGLPTGWQWKHYTASGTNLVKSGPAVLYAVVVNTTAAATVEIWDGLVAAAPGTQLAVLKASIAEGTYVWNAQMGQGLVVKLGGSSDITVLYA